VDAGAEGAEFKEKKRGTITQRSQRSEHRGHREERRRDREKRCAANEVALVGGAVFQGKRCVAEARGEGASAMAVS
jgi:hypothetical protein